MLVVFRGQQWRYICDREQSLIHVFWFVTAITWSHPVWCCQLILQFRYDSNYYTSASIFCTSEPAAFMSCNAIVASSSSPSFDFGLSDSELETVAVFVDFDHLLTDDAPKDDNEPVVWITEPVVVERSIVAITPGLPASLAMDSAKALFSALGVCDVQH